MSDSESLSSVDGTESPPHLARKLQCRAMERENSLPRKASGVAGIYGEHTIESAGFDSDGLVCVELRTYPPDHQTIVVLAGHSAAGKTTALKQMLRSSPVVVDKFLAKVNVQVSKCGRMHPMLILRPDVATNGVDTLVYKKQLNDFIVHLISHDYDHPLLLEGTPLLAHLASLDTKYRVCILRLSVYDDGVLVNRRQERNRRCDRFPRTALLAEKMLASIVDRFQYDIDAGLSVESVQEQISDVMSALLVLPWKPTPNIQDHDPNHLHFNPNHVPIHYKFTPN